jgi:hypothetical protein
MRRQVELPNQDQGSRERRGDHMRQTSTQKQIGPRETEKVSTEGGRREAKLGILELLRRQGAPRQEPIWEDLPEDAQVDADMEGAETIPSTEEGQARADEKRREYLRKKRKAEWEARAKEEEWPGIIEPVPVHGTN